jgi:hypothetical protein
MRHVVSYLTEVQFIDLGLSDNDGRRCVLHSVKTNEK